MPREKGLGMTVGERGFSLSNRCEIMGGRMREFSEAVMEYGRKIHNPREDLCRYQEEAEVFSQ